METVERFLALQEEHLGPEGFHLEIHDEMLGQAEKWPEEALGPRTVQFGTQQLPAISRLWIWTDRGQTLGWITVRLGTDRKIQFPQISSSRTNVDAHAFFAELLAVRDLAWWKTRTLLELVLKSSLPYEDGRRRSDAISDLPEDALQVVLGDVQDAAVSSQRTRRDRITDDRLRDVAGVYREAWDSGRNPTQEVARHFERPYSTASRWVVAARRAGFLGPADSSRGGEVGPVDYTPAADE